MVSTASLRAIGRPGGGPCREHKITPRSDPKHNIIAIFCECYRYHGGKASRARLRHPRRNRCQFWHCRETGTLAGPEPIAREMMQTPLPVAEEKTVEGTRAPPVSPFVAMSASAPSATSMSPLASSESARRAACRVAVFGSGRRAHARPLTVARHV